MNFVEILTVESMAASQLIYIIYPHVIFTCDLLLTFSTLDWFTSDTFDTRLIHFCGVSTLDWWTFDKLKIRLIHFLCFRHMIDCSLVFLTLNLIFFGVILDSRLIHVCHFKTQMILFWHFRHSIGHCLAFWTLDWFTSDILDTWLLQLFCFQCSIDSMLIFWTLNWFTFNIFDTWLIALEYFRQSIDSHLTFLTLEW